MGAYLGLATAEILGGSWPVSRSRGQRRPIDARFAHRRQRRRQVALGQAPAVVVGDQRMVEVARFGQAEQGLEQAVDRVEGADRRRARRG